MNVTQWFSGDVRPRHEGVYERRIAGMPGIWAYWNGKFWGVFWTREKCVETKNVRSAFQCAPHHEWRGLAERPK
jgi:putative component of toxin-antitoxin plasmid stabilization module